MKKEFCKKIKFIDEINSTPSVLLGIIVENSKDHIIVKTGRGNKHYINRKFLISIQDTNEEFIEVKNGF